MEAQKEVKLGNVGDVSFGLSEGKLFVKAEVGAKDLLEMLRKEVDGKLPAEAPAIDTVFGWLEAALAPPAAPAPSTPAA